MDSFELHRQSEAWLPRLFASVNQPRTQELIPEFAALSRKEKVDKAISLFRQLADQEPISELRPSRRWSLEYFQACGGGGRPEGSFLSKRVCSLTGKGCACPIEFSRKWKWSI